MKGVTLLLIGGILFILILIPLGTYGTLSPCGWLKAELKQAMAEKASQVTAKSDAEAAGAKLGLEVSIATANEIVDAMGPGQCFERVYQIKKHGGVEAYIKSQMEKQPSAFESAK